MNNMEKLPGEKRHTKPGVQKIEKTEYDLGPNKYIVSVIWKNGKESDIHFPTDGFPVVNPKTREELGYLTGEKAVLILKEHASEYNQDDFHWKNFL